MVSGVCTLRGLPGDYRLNAEEVCRKLRIHNNMVFLFGTLLPAYAKMSAKLALSNNYGITTFEIGLHHKRTMLSTPGHADN